MGGFTGKCGHCGRLQRWSSGNFEILTLKEKNLQFKFGVICRYCGFNMIIKDDFGEGPNPDDKWFDNDPPYQMDGETDGQFADRMYFDGEGNPR